MKICTILLGMSLSLSAYCHSVPDSPELPHLRIFILQDEIQTGNQFRSLIHSNANDLYPAFFCRVEHMWEKRTKMGSKFRLGSLDYVNYLESK